MNEYFGITITQQDDLYSKYELAYFSLKNNDTTTMYNILDNIPYIYELNDEQEANYEDYVSLFNILKTMQRDSINIFDLDSIAIDTLESIGSTCFHYPLAWANSILEQIRDDIEERYREEIPDAQGGSQRMEAPHRYVAPKEEFSQLKIYPNPAKEYIALDYEVQGNYQELGIEIINSLGKLVCSKLLQKQKNQKIVDMQSFKPGLYVVNLIGDGKIIDTQKLNIAR